MSLMRSYILTLAILVPSLVICQDLVITNVNIVPMSSDTVLLDRDVLIADGLITAIVSGTGTASVTGDITNIDGSGMFLTPGWTEMHAHIPTPKEGDETNVHETLFLYLSQGITTIRGMLGHPYHLSLRQSVQDSSVLSPNIYTSSPSMNGNTLPTADTARMLVEKYAAEGYDFLKVHPGIKRDIFDEMVKTAREVGIKFSGHVPLDVGIEHAIESRYASIDHLDGYIEGLAPKEMRNDGGFFGILLADHLDDAQIGVLAKATAKQNIAVVPTQTLFTRWLAPHQLEKQMNDPEMAYIPGSLRYTWRQNKERMMENLEFDEEQYDRFVEVRKRLIKTLHDEGVMLLLGSDAPQVMNVPGFSIHREMKTMADAGLTPYQILKSGTTNVAEFFGTSENTGSIETGKIADVVLLKNNPLENIGNCTDIEAVIYRGHLLTRDQIDAGLAEIAKKYTEE